MSLNASERREIEEIVRVVVRSEFQRMAKDISTGFAEAIDWYTENVATIMLSGNDKNEAWAAEMRAKIERMYAEAPQRKAVSGFGSQ
jgi:hypothetical protein